MKNYALNLLKCTRAVIIIIAAKTRSKIITYGFVANRQRISVCI